MSARKSETRPKTGSWRPFRPAGMSDGAWKTILLLHRYPTDEMDEEERKHCLGPMLFGKGGPRFGDYGRGWIQERADALVRGGLTPYAMDAREWRDEIADAIDYYNGMGFDRAGAEGFVAPYADFFTCNMSFPREWGLDKIVAAKDAARAKMDEIWYGICYGPFGAGPWGIMTKGVMNGWKNVFACDGDEAFQGIGNFDWRCASLGTGVDDVLEMAEMCPVIGNATIIGGIDLALDFAEKGGLSTNRRSRVVRFLKRAIGELYKRGEAMMKTMGEKATLSSFFKQVRKREWAAQDFFGGAIMPKAEECRARSDLLEEAKRREYIREEKKIMQMAESRPVSEMSNDEIDACIEAISMSVASVEMPKVLFNWAMDILNKLHDEQLARMRAMRSSIDREAVKARWAKEEDEEEAMEKLEAERKTKSKKGKRN